ncbi:PREDICTED: uncharacterized protein LOC108567574 [Nicrophorus vespilloides]|uniref:Uncharacterized protein LOC108567574 n=1 Tax=Nicrophorus vespilloides TaxID=110193 RepID=A0ABM1N9W4_NICVS|nr:PREDICTED: uncharacterized protein LOC108567574 [Nicrophorus vespilloides]
MRVWGWMGPLGPLLLFGGGLLLLSTTTQAQNSTQKANNSSSRNESVSRGSKKLFGDKCNATEECDFSGSVCDKLHGCTCNEDNPISNHLDKCGKSAKVNETCTFNEQCESETLQTECRDGTCVCMFEQQAITKSDGTHECISVKNEVTPERYVDPAMIGILVAMFLMFITICVVLRLFSR